MGGRAAESPQLFGRPARFKDDGHAHAHRLNLRPAVGDAGGRAGGELPLGGDDGPRPDDVYTSLRRYTAAAAARPNAAGLLRVLII